MAQTTPFIVGTRPLSLISETGFFLTDFSAKPTRTTQNEVMAVPPEGDTPELVFVEEYGLKNTFTLTGTPIPNAQGELHGLLSGEDCAIITTLANFVDDEAFGIILSTGTIYSHEPELKKTRSGTGREFTLNLVHSPYLV